MSIISANIQYNRGEHELLDCSSLQENYSSALAWAQDPYSNAAVGQYIYIRETETIDGNIYIKGAYIIEKIGEAPIITLLSNTIQSLSLKREVIDNINYIVLYGNNDKEIGKVSIDNTSINAGEY